MRKPGSSPVLTELEEFASKSLENEYEGVTFKFYSFFICSAKFLKNYENLKENLINALFYQYVALKTFVIKVIRLDF